MEVTAYKPRIIKVRKPKTPRQRMKTRLLYRKDKFKRRLYNRIYRRRYKVQLSRKRKLYMLRKKFKKG